MRQALLKVGQPAAFAVLPLLVLVVAAFVAVRNDDLAVDFRGELYPAAGSLLHGDSPFPAPDADLRSGVNPIFPIPAVALAVPLRALPAGAAAAVFTAVLLASLLGALWLLGVRDWRVYGLVLLWPPALAALQTGNVTALLALAVAVGWRWRHRPVVAGLALGLAVALKLFLWPLLLWLVVTRRFLAGAVAVAVAAAGTLAVLPFMGLRDYLTLMQNLSDTFGDQAYSPAGLLAQLGAGDQVARYAAAAIGLGALAYALHRRSLGLVVVASLLLSPIVWLHYFVLLVVPLGIASPRLSAGWAMPLATWWAPGNGVYVHARDTALVLASAGAAVVVATRRGVSALHIRTAP